MKTIAMIFGIILTVVGILGFVPEAAPRGYLLGIFHINSLHNIIHILSGVVGIWAGLTSTSGARLFFKIFGIIYGVVTLLGLYYQNEPIFGVLANNWHDVWLHALISAVSIYFGFCCKGCCSSQDSCCK